MLDLIIQGGQVVTPQAVGKWILAFKGRRLLPSAGREHYQLTRNERLMHEERSSFLVGSSRTPISVFPCRSSGPGIPDVMTQPPEAASRAAAFGGVTTIIDFAGDLSLQPGWQYSHDSNYARRGTAA